MDINSRDFKEILSHLKLSFIMQPDAAVISACFTLEVQLAASNAGRQPSWPLGIGCSFNFRCQLGSRKTLLSIVQS